MFLKLVLDVLRDAYISMFVFKYVGLYFAYVPRPRGPPRAPPGSPRGPRVHEAHGSLRPMPLGPPWGPMPLMGPPWGPPMETPHGVPPWGPPMGPPHGPSPMGPFSRKFFSHLCREKIVRLHEARGVLRFVFDFFKSSGESGGEFW